MSAADIAAGYRALARVLCGHPGRPRRWATRAACAGNAALFLDPATQTDALAVCATCPVQTECRDDVLAFERSAYRWRVVSVGVVGGLTPFQRRAIHRADLTDRRRRDRTGELALFGLADLTELGFTTEGVA